MAPRKDLLLSAVALDRHLELSLADICDACGLRSERLIEMVAEGLLEPRGATPTAWRFDGLALERVRIAVRLQQDLDVNLAGAALVLDMLDELRMLRQRVCRLEGELNKL